MSLLLEALKKAELAKQVAETAPAPAAEAPVGRTGPKADELTLVQEPREPVITRENLPDISQPLEIRSEDLPSTVPTPQPSQAAEQAAVQPAPERPALAIGEPPGSRPPAEPAPAAENSEMRDAARAMFDVKEVDYNPRRPFYITVAALLTAGVGYGVYVWWQMQPHYAVNTSAVNVAAAPKPAEPASPAQQAASVPPPAAPASDVATSASAAGAAIPVAAPKAIDSSAKTAPGTPVFRPVAESAAREAATSSVPIVPPRRETAARRGTTEAPISITPSPARIDPALQSAYDSYGRGDWANARAQYEKVLERDPGNRDALLGLASLDVREHSYDTAELRYLKLLEFNPRDTYAFAGLMALQGNVDPVQSESRIKSLLASQPDATHLYFTLGNQYSAQGRWSEAEDAYFKAYTASPQNPDYAFNLAVSLDHLRQSRLALDYYRKALAAADRQPAAFSRPQAEARIAELQR